MTECSISAACFDLILETLLHVLCFSFGKNILLSSRDEFCCSGALHPKMSQPNKNTGHVALFMHKEESYD